MDNPHETRRMTIISENFLYHHNEPRLDDLTEFPYSKKYYGVIQIEILYMSIK